MSRLITVHESIIGDMAVLQLIIIFFDASILQLLSGNTFIHLTGICIRVLLESRCAEMPVPSYGYIWQQWLLNLYLLCYYWLFIKCLHTSHIYMKVYIYPAFAFTPPIWMSKELHRQFSWNTSKWILRVRGFMSIVCTGIVHTWI